MPHFVTASRDQGYLLSLDMKDWTPGEDRAHFLIEAVERADLSHFHINATGSGSAQYPFQGGSRFIA